MRLTLRELMLIGFSIGAVGGMFVDRREQRQRAEREISAAKCEYYNKYVQDVAAIEARYRSKK